jgi:transcriptional regulator with XRE-family HTH domain
MKTARDLFAKRVRELRAERGWSQDDLADAAGLHRTYIGTIERAEQSIGLDNIEKIAKALKVSIAELFRE